MRLVPGILLAFSLAIFSGQTLAQGNGTPPTPPGQGGENPGQPQDNEGKSSIDVTVMCYDGIDDGEYAEGDFKVTIEDQTGDQGVDATVSVVGYVCTTETGPGRPFSARFDAGTLGPAAFVDNEELQGRFAVLYGNCKFGVDANNDPLVQAGQEWKVQVDILEGVGTNNNRKDVSDNCHEQVKR